MNLSHLRESIDQKTDKIRLFRNPHSRMKINDLIELVNNNSYDGRYYTIHPEEAIGYYNTGQLIEIEIPTEEVAPEQELLISNLIIDDPKPTRSDIQKGATEAIKIGVPKDLVEKIIQFTLKKQKLLNKAEKTDIIYTTDGCLTKEMASILKRTFPYFQERAGQVQLLTRNIKQGELIAIYDYTTDKTTKFTITKVTKISGTPTLTKGQILQNP